MTRKIYRTANGKMVDIGALQLQNENVRAVGNMGVNARGDLIDSGNKTINTRNQQVNKQYKKQTRGNVSDTPVVSSTRQPSPQQPVPSPVPQKIVQQPETINNTEAPVGGLAAAIAKARAISQEPMSPAPSRNSDGPVKI